MIRNYFRVIHFTIENIIIGNTQPAHDVLGTSPEGPLTVLTSGTCKRPSGDSQGTNTKIDHFMKKKFFRNNSPCITYLFLILQEEQIFESSKRGRLRDPVAGRPWDIISTSVGRRSNMSFN